MLYAQGPLSMSDIAGALGITNGALTSHIRMLADAGFVAIDFSSGKHGIQRIITASEQRILIESLQTDRNVNVYESEISVGHYSNYEVFPTCGLATPEHLVGQEDDPRYFASPERVNATILWLGHGYVEYLLPNFLKSDQKPIEMQISLEIGSEAPGSCDDWPSDLSFYLNGQLLLTWTSPGDFGRNRGIYNPKWWDRVWNQYGLFKLLSVNNDGAFMDGRKLSDITLKDLKVDHHSNLVLRIAAPRSAKNAGGLTIFGRHFGNYDQDIRFRMQYRKA